MFLNISRVSRPSGIGAVEKIHTSEALAARRLAAKNALFQHNDVITYRHKGKFGATDLRGGRTGSKSEDFTMRRVWAHHRSLREMELAIETMDQAAISSEIFFLLSMNL